MILFQAQDSINSSFFDFPVDNIFEEEEVQSVAADPSTLPADIREKLMDLKIYLEQDVSILVFDANPIRNLLHQLKPHLLTETQQTIIPTAKQRISDWQARESLVKEVESKKAIVKDTKAKVDLLKSSHPSIISKINELETCKADFKRELELVGKELRDEREKLEQLPIKIDQLEQDSKVWVADALKLHRRTKPIQGVLADDQCIIDKINQIRLRAIDVIQALL